MSKSKLTLLVDGNWLLMSRLSVIQTKYLDDYELCHNLKLMMIRSINIVLKQFPSIDNIIFCADGGSWRNKVEVPQFLQKDGIEYKGSRVRSEDFNWELLFSSYDDFVATLNNCGITSCREIGVEGDDWCYHWSTLLNSQGTNCIIWTKDKDLTQLVKMNKDKCFTVLWNKDNGLVTSDTSDDDMDFLFNYDFNINETIFNDICNKSKNILKVNTNNIVIDKIIKGDISDNIIPVAMRRAKSKESDKKFRISAKDINYNINIDNNFEVREYFENLLESKSYKGRIDQTLDEVIEHFNYNKKLIRLHKSSYPENIQSIFDNYQTYNMCCDISKAEQQITMESNKLQGVLDII